eukprot:5104748-Prorocentrum_lima.AAC.1
MLILRDATAPTAAHPEWLSWFKDRIPDVLYQHPVVDKRVSPIALPRLSTWRQMKQSALKGCHMSR